MNFLPICKFEKLNLLHKQPKFINFIKNTNNIMNFLTQNLAMSQEMKREVLNVTN